MANAPYLESLIGGLDREMKRALRPAWEYILANLRLGRISKQGERMENFQLYPIEGVTPGTANLEFSIPHSLNTPPYIAIPVLNLQAVGSEVVRLKVTRLADSQRVYLSSPDINKPITLLIEG